MASEKRCRESQKCPPREPDYNALIENLERLKSNMLLLLNVIMYAGQIRR